MAGTSPIRFLVILLVVAVGCFIVSPTFFPEKFEDTPFEDLKISLGLDLRGGSYLLLEVDVEAYNLDQMNVIVDEMRRSLRSDGFRFNKFELADDYKRIEFELKERSQVGEKKNYKKVINKVASSNFNIHFKSYLDDRRGHIIVKDEFFTSLQSRVLKQTLEIMRRRTDESGLKEIEVQKQGARGILLQVPGVTDPKLIKSIVGRTAKLSFHLVDNSYNINDVLKGKLPSGLMVVKGAGGIGHLVLKREESITGDMLADANATIVDSPKVIVHFNNVGARRFSRLTGDNVGKRLAILLDGEVISAPVINEHIPGGRSSISGNFTTEEANELAILLRAGALPAPLKVLEEKTIGPSLGQDSIAAGKASMTLAVCLIAATIIILYRLFGFFVLMGLVVNLILLLGLLSLTGAALTLSGIAGIILTLGIAVDANVLIIERIKEEYARTGNVIISITNGFNNSFITIVDANLTTVFTALMLFLFGTGYVKGFAITLIFGITASMFSSIMFTRFVTLLWYRFAKPKRLKL